MKRVIKYIRYANVVYLALYFLFNAAFIHNHIINGESISHAHIFKGANHTQEEAGLIQLFNLTAAETAPEATLSPIGFSFPVCFFTLPEEVHTSADHSTATLRGPPYILF